MYLKMSDKYLDSFVIMRSCGLFRGAYIRGVEMTPDMVTGYNADKRARQVAKAHGWVKEAIKANKAAWDLVPSLRTAMIAQKYAEVVSGQAMETVRSEWLTTLWQDMLELAGLTS